MVTSALPLPVILAELQGLEREASSLQYRLGRTPAGERNTPEYFALQGELLGLLARDERLRDEAESLGHVFEPF